MKSIVVRRSSMTGHWVVDFGHTFGYASLDRQGFRRWEDARDFAVELAEQRRNKLEESQ